MTEEELNSVRRIKAELKGLEQARLNLLSIAEDLVPIIDGTPRAIEVKSKVEALALKILRIDEQIAEAKSRLLVAKLGLAEKIIAGIADPLRQKVALLRYVSCLPYRVIARQMRLSLRHVYRIHEKILQSLTRI